MSVLERFLRYVKIDTTSYKDATQKPTSQGQVELLKLLKAELDELGLNAVYHDAGYVTAKIPANIQGKKKIAFLAHVDTSSEVSGKDINVNTVVFDGESIKYSNGLEINLTTNPELASRKGEEILITDGTTLLGADDKAGIAEIMAMVETLVKNPNIVHGDVIIGFTSDEEIGRGTENFDVQEFGADVGYTVDGETMGEIDYHNFCGGNAIIKIAGIPAHTGYAKNKMINAINVLGDFMQLFPEGERPSTTEGFEGFYHFYKVEGNMKSASAEIMLRDFFVEKYQEKKEFVLSCVDKINAKYGKDTVKCEFIHKINNMYEVVKDHMYLIEIAKKAFTENGVKPLELPVRGGTDGARLSFKGLPCPNLSMGGGNAHSVREYLPKKDLYTMTEILLLIVKHFGEME